MELKFRSGSFFCKQVLSINRTFMELKYENEPQGDETAAQY